MKQQSFELTPPTLKLSELRANESPEVRRLNAAYEKARSYLTTLTVREVDFIDLYHEGVRRDLELLKQTRRKISQEKGSGKLGTIFEAIVIEQINQREGWLGDNVVAIRTSDFDDVLRGVDFVAEFQGPNRSASHLALGMDVTSDPRRLLYKFTKIRQEIENDELTMIKYFRSNHMGFRGELTEIPRVIVGVDNSQLIRLMRVWINPNSNLARDPVQVIFLAQIQIQLEKFIQFARKKGSTQAEQTLNAALDKIKGILSTKVRLGDKQMALQDQVTIKMLEVLRQAFEGESISL